MAERRAFFPIVGIGSSAGGLEALKKLFANVPKKPNMAFVVIPHLDPSKKSYMVELLARETKMPVVQVSRNTAIHLNEVYVLPPNHNLTVKNGTLQLTKLDSRKNSKNAIDIFFRSLAQARETEAIGILLSGTSNAGVLGLQAIKESNGMTIVQDPATAAYASMPSAAIAAGVVDQILAPEKIGDALLGFSAHYPKIKTSESVTADHLTPILSILQTRAGLSFRHYRKNMLLRRIRRRMALHRIETLEEYDDYLREHHLEVAQLANDLLIAVTSFFRDPEAFAVLKKLVFPKLMQKKVHDEPIRIWVPACASGEEAYSLGMLILEQQATSSKICPVQIFATDVNEAALEKARRGTYLDSIATDVTPSRIKKFFNRTEGNMLQVCKQLRKIVTFASQSLLRDPPFSRMDLVSCRNLMIYLEPEVQQKILAVFHFALKPNGYLFLGPSETIGRQVNLFESVSRKHRIFQRIGPVRSEKLEISIDGVSGIGELSKLAVRPSFSRSSFQEVTHRLIVEDFSPAAVLIDRRSEVLYFHGNINLYIEHPNGEPSRDLLKILLECLRSRVRSAILKATREARPIVVHGVHVKRGKTERFVRLTVRPIKDPPDMHGLLLVVFEEDIEGEYGSRQQNRFFPKERDALIRNLENELSSSREDHQNAVEEVESANEELKASNEEITSINEELQSSNEELETSKEELQSLNEELTTVNNQLQEKVQEVEKANDDIVNLLASTQIPTVFLSPEMEIRLFNPTMTELLHVLPTDIGRSIEDFTLTIEDKHLFSDAKQVLKLLVPVEREVCSKKGTWYLRRTLPYRTADDRIHGVVITYVDISEQKNVIEKLRQLNEELDKRVKARTQELESSNQEAIRERDRYKRAEERLCLLTDNAPVMISYISQAKKFEFVNKRHEEWLGIPLAQIVGRKVRDVLGSEVYKKFKDHIALGLKGKKVSFECEVAFPKETRHVAVNYFPHLDAQGCVVGLVTAVIDLSELHVVQLQLVQAQKMEIVGRLVGGVAHDFNNLITAINGYVQVFHDKLVDDENVREEIKELTKASEVATVVVRQLLAIGQREIVNKKIFDMHSVLRRLKIFLQRLIGEDILIQMELDQRPAMVRADSGQIEQIVLNLVINARDAMPKGGRLTIRTERSAPKKDAATETHSYIRLSVIDTGVGIDKQIMAKIFEPFFTTKGEGKGTGLGLSTVMRLVKESGGQIEVQSKRAKGTRFMIDLPLVKAKAQPEKIAVLKNQNLHGKETVLVVDDETLVRLVAGHTLRKMGYTVLEAAGPQKALSLVRGYRGHIDLLLTDVIMPSLNGQELAQKLKRYRPELKVLYISGYPGEGVQRKGILKAGVNLLEKPFTPDEFLGKIRAVLDHVPIGDL